MLVDYDGRGQPVDAETIKSLARHPANIISNICTGLLLAFAGTLLNVWISVTVAVGRGFREGLGAGFAFCGDNLKDVMKLYLTYVLLMIPFVITSWIPQLISHMWIGITVGVMGAAILGYVSIVNFGLAASLITAKAESAKPSSE